MNYIEATVKTTHGDMDYIRFGRGQKIFVMIAGMSMTGLAGLGEPVYDAYKMFEEEYTVYTFDRVSYLPDGYGIRDMARDTAEAMKILGIENADIMGASQGGMIGLYLAMDYPKLVHSLILASSCSYLNSTGIDSMKIWSRLADSNDSVGIYRDFFHRAFTHPDMTLLSAVENTGTASQCRRFGILARACAEFDCRSELHKVRCPVLVITADNDKVLSCEPAEETARLLGCECYVYKGYGHTVYDEAPDYKQRILNFFTV